MSGFAVFPLLRAPESWPTWAVGAGAMVVLAALDIVGALAAKEWAASSRVGALLLGAAAFLVLFWVYASALQYAELALVTMGWIVVLQVALLLSGAVLTETTFNWPGLGYMAKVAIKNQDFYLIQAIVLVVAVIVVVLNIAIDLAYKVLDPRVELN